MVDRYVPKGIEETSTRARIMPPIDNVVDGHS